MRSLVWATDIDVLPADRVLLRRDDHLVIRCPGNPTFRWGNSLLFDRPPEPGDRDRWLASFAAEFPDSDHRVFAWDTTDGRVGAAGREFPDFERSEVAGLTAAPGELRPRPGAAEDIVVAALDPVDDPRWGAVLELWMSRDERDDTSSDRFAVFATQRLRELRTLLAAGRGGWFVALDGREVVGSLGIVVTEGRARYQNVDTLQSHRRRGVASRLVFDAARQVARTHAVEVLIITADPGYHALGLYESLGFRRRERVVGVDRVSPEDDLGSPA